MTGSYLNAGCGPQAVTGWVNLDTDPDTAADLRGDVTALPFRAAVFHRVYASHLLEHLGYFDQLPAALAEFRRVLAPDGWLAVICPDIERAVLIGEPRTLLEAIVAWPDEWNTRKWPVKTPPRGHAWTATAQFVTRALLDAGFGDVRDYSGQLPRLRADGWPVVAVDDWQCGFTAAVIDR